MMKPDRRPDIIDCEAERAFLAASLRNLDAAFFASLVAGKSNTYVICRDDFTDSSHRALWDVVQCALKAGFAGYAYPLSLELRGDPDFERVGGVDWLMDLATSPPSMGIDEAASRIIRASLARNRYIGSAPV